MRNQLVPRAAVVLVLLGAATTGRPAAGQGPHGAATSAAADTGGARRGTGGALPTQTSFAQSQLRYDRVLNARVEARFEVKRLFRERGIRYPAAEIFMRIFKRERELELWVRPSTGEPFALLKTYHICALAGELGPKRRQGDEQVPEGFYYVDHFNPQSDYLLSLHLDYPNRSDALLGNGGSLGGDIYIHGGCNSAGCLALTDDGIKEVYWLSVEARGTGQSRIPVHIFPARLTDAEMPRLAQAFRKTPAVLRFWESLKPGYEYFEREHRVPRMNVAGNGRYQLAGEDRLSSSAGGATTPLGTPVQAEAGTQPPPRPPLGDTAQASQSALPDSAGAVRPTLPTRPGGG
jgi:murein L,D-transpeptidase YafK